MSENTETEHVGQRIKLIRNHFHLTQDEFGKRLSTARNTIANYENGNRSPSKAVISLICKEFSINEAWLFTGDGGSENMFSNISDDDRYSIALGKLSASENKFIQNALITLAETDPDKLKIIEEFMKNCLGIK